MNLNLLGRIGARRNTPLLAAEEEDDETAEGEERPEEEANADDPEDENEPAEEARRKATSAKDEDKQAATAGQIARLCAEAGCPAMAEELVVRGVSLAELRERIGSIARVRAMVDTARRVNKAAVSMSVADRFLAAGHSPAEAGEALLEMLAEAQSPEIRNSHGAGARPGERVDHGWDRIVAGVNARLP